MRIKVCVAVVPLYVVWILFQITHYKRATESNNHNFKSEATDLKGKRQKIVNDTEEFASKLNWVPPESYDESDSKDDDIHEFLRPMKTVKQKRTNKLWFMKGGDIRPEQVALDIELELWPEHNKGDRIIEQLMYLPKNYTNEWDISSPLSKFQLYDLDKHKLKKIFLIGDFLWHRIPSGRGMFWKDKCPVNTCTFVTTLEEVKNADAVVIKGAYFNQINFLIRKRPNHIWILYLEDPPMNVGELRSLRHLINWTASYRHDSDIVIPFGKFAPYNLSLDISHEMKIKKTKYKNAVNKTKKVAWFATDCNLRSRRYQYALMLNGFIQVDIYGPCGHKCPQEMYEKCLELLDKDYKFYLSFEKRKCSEYITEVFFKIGLGHDVLPIVMGPPRKDYAQVAPPNSFIHVNDFSTPKELATYLHVLDANDTLYNEYFKWKGTGEMINTRFWCRLCSLLHSPRKNKSYEDIGKWWNVPGVCESDEFYFFE